MDFQIMSAANFSDEQIFVEKFIEYVGKLLSRNQELMKAIDTESLGMLSSLKNKKNLSMDILFDILSRICQTAKNLSF